MPYHISLKKYDTAFVVKLYIRKVHHTLIIIYHAGYRTKSVAILVPKIGK